ncbi:MAG: hypothetical protein GTO24_20990 [candidate division Zixibacteria bacterium]|nr:hypothetical protein [candidate division Zixibacteria bacterium]
MKFSDDRILAGKLAAKVEEALPSGKPYVRFRQLLDMYNNEVQHLNQILSEFITTCEDCGGKGGLTAYNPAVGYEQFAECGTCEGAGFTINHDYDVRPLNKELDSLKKFWNKLCVHMWDFWELDGGTFQDWGEEFGLLVKENYDPERHGHIDADPGDPVFINFYTLGEKGIDQLLKDE